MIGEDDTKFQTKVGKVVFDVKLMKIVFVLSFHFTNVAADPFQILTGLFQ